MEYREGCAVVTAATSNYYESLVTLIASVHRHSYDLVDEIVVYDLGLEYNQIEELKGYSKTKYVTFPTICGEYFEGYLHPKSYAYKLYCVAKPDTDLTNILWLDAGVMALQSLEEIFKIIKREHIFLVGDQHLNRDYTSKKCQKILNATVSELNDTQLSAGILGYRRQGRYNRLIEEAFEFSKIPDCVPREENNHRHDQSVYSILASRYNCKKYDIDRFGYWTDINRNLESAINNDAVIFVHRRGHFDRTGLIRK